MNNDFLKYWIRLNVIVGWPLLFIIDAMATLWGNDWKELRHDTNAQLKRIWNKYKNTTNEK